MSVRIGEEVQEVLHMEMPITGHYPNVRIRRQTMSPNEEKVIEFMMEFATIRPI